MSDAGQQYTPPGWYPDPSGAQQQRWWDGMQWSQATQQHALPYNPTATSGTGRVDISTSTRAIWAIAFLPLVSLLGSIAYLALSDPAVLLGETGSTGGAADVLNVVLTFALYIAYVVLGFADYRTLESRGLDRPFARGWAFLPVVYVIGRSVVVHQRTGRGLAPLFTWIGTTVGQALLSFALGLVVGILLVSQSGV